MNTLLEKSPVTDAELVALSRSGHRDAFATIIARYQSLICAITYNSCGNAARSEELAQDTFVAAWRDLGGLHEPAKLKSWLCGIARNLVQNSLRRDHQVPTARAEPLSPELTDAGASPSEKAVSEEEERLVWRTLASIPADYREPMILYYREGQSASAVAAALDLTEEAVWQRLSRGRAMLRKGVEEQIETTLGRTRPNEALATAVLAALPASPLPMAALGSAVAKGGFVKTAVTLGAAVGWIGLYGLNARAFIQNSKSPRERNWLARRLLWRLGVGSVVGLLLFAAARQLPPSAYSGVKSLDPMVQDVLLAAGLFGLALYGIVMVGRINRQRRQIQIEDGTWTAADWTAPESPNALLTAPKGAEASLRKVQLLTLVVSGLFFFVSGLGSMHAGHWARAAFELAMVGFVPWNLRRLRWQPRFDARSSTSARGALLCGVFTLIIYNSRHFSAWTGAAGGLSGVMAFNLGVILAYALLVRRFARRQNVHD